MRESSPRPRTRDPEIQKSRNPEIQKSRNPEIQKSRNPEIQKSRNPENPENPVSRKPLESWKQETGNREIIMSLASHLKTFFQPYAALGHSTCTAQMSARVQVQQRQREHWTPHGVVYV
jgi:hypothetical protein